MSEPTLHTCVPGDTVYLQVPIGGGAIPSSHEEIVIFSVTRELRVVACPTVACTGASGAWASILWEYVYKSGSGDNLDVDKVGSREQRGDKQQVTEVGLAVFLPARPSGPRRPAHQQ